MVDTKLSSALKGVLNEFYGMQLKEAENLQRSSAFILQPAPCFGNFSNKTPLVCSVTLSFSVK